MNINLRTDYSFLFNSMGNTFGTGNTSVASTNFLADYASIKNGSYAKLMKAYYGKPGSVDSLVPKTNSTSKDDAKTLAKVQSTTDDLKEAADALLVQGKDSLFAVKDITTTDKNGVSSTTKGYNTDRIYKGVSALADAYNSVINASKDVNSTSIDSRISNMQNFVSINAKSLAAVGITLDENNKLSVDEKVFKASNMSAVKSLFNENGSVGYRLSAQASLINFAADNEANKAATYNMFAGYNNPFSSGSIYSSYF